MCHARFGRLAIVFACAAGTVDVRGQIQIIDQVTITGVVEAVAADRVTVRDEAGMRHEVLVQRSGERGVALRNGKLLAFPAEVQVTGALDVVKIEPGQIVRLPTRLNSRGAATGDLVAKSLVVENQDSAGVRDRGDDALEKTYRGLSDEPPKEPRLVRSRHFAFLTDVSDREWAVIRDKLERMATNLERYFGRKGNGVVEGFIVRDLAAWPDGVLQEAAGVEKIRRGEGVCFNATLGPQRRATLYSCDTHGVIQHECVHGFCHLTFGSTGPTWLAEGVAELGNYWREGDTSVEIDPAVMAYIRTATPKRRLTEIAVPGREPAGTWQDYAWRWALCHLLANNPNYADRFRPLAVALMEEKPAASFEATYGPVARELSFEYDQFLETVGNGSRVDLAAWPWKAKFRPLAAVFHDFTLTPPIPIGAKSAFTAPAEGQLFLRCEDDWTQLGDNEGEIRVVIRRP